MGNLFVKEENENQDEIYFQERFRIFCERLNAGRRIMHKHMEVTNSKTKPTTSKYTVKQNPCEDKNIIIISSIEDNEPIKPLWTYNEDIQLKLEEIPKLNLVELNNFHPSTEVSDLFTYHYRELRYDKNFTSSVAPSNFCDLYQYLLNIEDLETIKQTNELIRTNVAITKYENIENKNLFEMNVKYENYATTVLDVHLNVKIICKCAKEWINIFGFVNSVVLNTDNTINLKIIVPNNVMAKYLESNPNQLYEVNFRSSRTRLKMEHTALEVVRKSHILPFLFPTNIEKVNFDYKNKKLIWINKSLLENSKQMKAVQNIVLNDSNRTAPYIVFGPPGTGKSTVIIESILQILKENRNAKILCCANSNNACNMFAKRLLYFVMHHKNATDILVEGDILRLFGQSTSFADVDKVIMKISNFYQDRIHYYPCLKEIHGKKVVIATMVTSGRLDQGHINKNHFTHIFIDEAESCREPTTLIPIILSCYNKKINAKIILCGDYKQLGPVVRHKLFSTSSLGVSMIERLLGLHLYKRNHTTWKHNPNYIVKLTKNYRSHASIIAVPNKLFYNKNIICVGDKVITHAALDLKCLNNKKIPIIFHSVQGKCYRENDSPSCYNDTEISFALNYANLFLNDDLNRCDKLIAILTMYEKQALKIQQRCIQRFGADAKRIEISTVDSFQGEERPIIILSTVRSDTKKIEFISNPKRINLALTRAQSLLIVIGDTVTLSRDTNWKTFIQYCMDHGCIK